MKRSAIYSTVALATLTLAAPVLGQDVGTAAEAKAMLEKTVVAVTADKAKTLDQINKGEGGFKDRDLYPFCGDAGSGQVIAHPSEAIRKLKLADIKDKSNYAFGAEMMKVAKEGAFSEVSYMWPKPSGGEPVQKVSFVTKVSDLVCGVGYYK